MCVCVCGPRGCVGVALFSYEARHQEGGMSLQNLLIAPVQRIPRYALLLGELLKNTPPSKTDTVQQQHHDDLTRALEMVRRTAKYVGQSGGWRLAVGVSICWLGLFGVRSLV